MPYNLKFSFPSEEDSATFDALSALLEPREPREINRIKARNDSRQLLRQIEAIARRDAVDADLLHEWVNATDREKEADAAYRSAYAAYRRVYDALRYCTRIEVLTTDDEANVSLGNRDGWFSERVSELELASVEYGIEVDAIIRDDYRTLDQSSSAESTELELQFWDEATAVGSTFLVKPAPPFSETDGKLNDSHPLVDVIRRAHGRPVVQFGEDVAKLAASPVAPWLGPLLFGIKWISRATKRSPARCVRQGYVAGHTTLWAGRSAMRGVDVWILKLWREPVTTSPESIVRWRLEALERIGVLTQRDREEVMSGLDSARDRLFYTLLPKSNMFPIETYLSQAWTTVLLVETFTNVKLSSPIIAALVTAGVTRE